MNRQMTLAEINDEFGAARTNKKEFLNKMDSVIPWETFVKEIEPYYYKGERGNKPYPLELMLRIYMLQNLYDPDAHSAKKGNTWHFGYKMHIGVDGDSGLVHHVKTTSANKHDVTATSELMHGEEETLNGDSGYNRKT